MGHPVRCRCPQCQGALFGVAEPKRTRRRTPAARYAPIKPRKRTLCGDCVLAIHELGVMEAPYPGPVRWRRSADGDIRYLCEMHKDERQEKEK